MTEENPALDAQVPVEAEAPSVAETAPPPERARLPPWFPYFIAAFLPAVLVGLVVYAFAGGGGGSDKAAAILEGFFAAPSSGGNVSTYAGELPPTFPKEFPVFKGAEVVVSFTIPAEQGTSYLAVLTTSASADEVYNFYIERLEEDPWQVEVARSSQDFTGVRFSRPDDADLSGDVTVFHSTLGDTTTIYVSFRDLSLSRAPGPAADKPFVLGQSRPLPEGFPKDLPIYKGDSASIIIDTYLELSPGSRTFIVTFLTKNSQDDVIDFYQKALSDLGWSVTDTAAGATGFALGLDFRDRQAQGLEGSIRADDFPPDDDYTKVDLLVRVSTSRGRGN
jgi:hypothetical protein